MNIVGISAYHHDSAAAWLSAGFIQGAAHEERFTRKKFDNRFPISTLQWLRTQREQVDTVAFYEQKDFMERQNIRREIKKTISGKFNIEFFDHHECHAMSSICTTTWDSCAVMVVDSMGGKYATSLGIFENNKITWLKRFEYPNSLGLFYSTVTRFLGFTPMMDEEKVMSAAAFGEPKWADYLKEKVIKTEFGNYNIIRDLRRGVGTAVLDWDIAKSAQDILQECLINLAAWLHKETGQFKLAYAGGVALNCAANTALANMGLFDNIWIIPNPGDAGSSLGCIAASERRHLDWKNPFLGHNIEGEYPVDKIIKELTENKIVGVANGRAEFGPRALGNRSLLADPRGLEIKDMVNQIKRRQKFRPFAPAILEEDVNEYFDLPKGVLNTPYMQYTATYTHGKDCPAIIHYDNTSRVQTVAKRDNEGFYELLKAWKKKTGCPMLLNTSLNIKGMPMVNDTKDGKAFTSKYGVKVL